MLDPKFLETKEMRKNQEPQMRFKIQILDTCRVCGAIHQKPGTIRGRTAWVQFINTNLGKPSR